MKNIEAITFDCYGTLVDWEAGILAALRPRLQGVPDRQILERYAALEAEAEKGPYQSYRQILGKVERGFGLPEGQLADTVRSWPLFKDTAEALKRLSHPYWLVIVSNIDADMFAETARELGVPFDHVVTATAVQSYKPAPAHFHEALKLLGLKPSQVLHAAQSLYHDIAPARALGFHTAWIDRRRGLDGTGATPPSKAMPDYAFPDLKSLADHLC